MSKLNTALFVAILLVTSAGVGYYVWRDQEEIKAKNHAKQAKAQAEKDAMHVQQLLKEAKQQADLHKQQVASQRLKLEDIVQELAIFYQLNAHYPMKQKDLDKIAAATGTKISMVLPPPNEENISTLRLSGPIPPMSFEYVYADNPVHACSTHYRISGSDEKENRVFFSYGDEGKYESGTIGL
jgi:hypothetical protein